MKFHLSVIFFIFNCLVINAATEESEAPIPPATCVKGAITQLKANHAAQIARYDKFIKQRQTALEGPSEDREICTKLITDATAKKTALTREISALDALIRALEQTPCIDIGGIRTPPSQGHYILADASHVTINACQKSLPNLWFSHALNFGELLRTFPELRTILSRRSTPANCLVSHVGNNIFEDALEEQLKEEYATMGCSTEGCSAGGCSSSLYSLQDVIEHAELLTKILPKFVADLAEFLKLFKGGSFTYRSVKRSLIELVTKGYMSIPTRSPCPVESYVCMLEGRRCKFMQHSCSADICPHEELFYNILTQVLGLPHTITQIHLLNMGQAGVYSQTTTFIPEEFTGEVDSNKLRDVSALFLSQRRNFKISTAAAA